MYPFSRGSKNTRTCFQLNVSYVNVMFSTQITSLLFCLISGQCACNNVSMMLFKKLESTFEITLSLY